MDVQSFTTSGWQVVYYQVFETGGFQSSFTCWLKLISSQPSVGSSSGSSIFNPCWCFLMLVLHGPYKSFYFCSIMCLAYNYLVVVSLCDGFSFVFVAMAITCHALSDKIGSTLSPEWGFCNGAQLQPQKCDLQACKHVIFTILCN